MKERPVYMTLEEIRAILDGRKTQKRFVIKPRYKDDESGFNVISRPATGERWVEKADEDGGDFEDGTRIVPCPFGEVGDRLWVKETWFHGDAWYDDDEWMSWKNTHRDGECTWVDYKATETEQYFDECWKSPITMPRWASRITLEITDIRVERVQDISEEDAVTEGIEFREPYWMGATHPVKGTPKCMVSAKNAYRTIWDSLNAKRGYPWENNDWVWVIIFKVVEDGK